MEEDNTIKIMVTQEDVAKISKYFFWCLSDNLKSANTNVILENGYTIYLEFDKLGKAMFKALYVKGDRTYETEEFSSVFNVLGEKYIILK